MWRNGEILGNPRGRLRFVRGRQVTWSCILMIGVGAQAHYVLCMFADLLARLIAPAPAPLAAPDAQLALSALLVRVARSDGQYDTTESARITRIAMERFNMTESEAQALRQEAEGLEAEAPDTVRFTRAIKDAVPLDDRIGVVEALWSVVLDDGERHQNEDAMMRLVANLLGVTDQHSNAARLRVAKG